MSLKSITLCFVASKLLSFDFMGNSIPEINEDVKSPRYGRVLERGIVKAKESSRSTPLASVLRFSLCSSTNQPNYVRDNLRS